METIIFEPGGDEGKFAEGTKLIEASEELGIEIETPCGKKGECGQCKVIVEDGGDNLSPLDDSEKKLLSEEERADGYRLSCRAKIEGGPIKVRVPPESQRKGQIILTEGREIEIEKNPVVKKYHLEIPRATLEDPMADYERVSRGLKSKYGIEISNIDYQIQMNLPNILRRGKRRTPRDSWEITTTVWDSEEIINVEQGFEEETYGIAVDLGTTTLAGYLLDLKSGEVKAVTSSLNPQLSIGEDLITRIEYGLEKDDGRRVLQEKVVEAVNQNIIEELIDEAGVQKEDIYEIVFAGNTAMHHLFLGIDPQYLAKSPFPPGRQSSVPLKAGKIGIDINKRGYCYWLPLIGGWVGADNVGVLLASKIYDQSKMSLVIDIGTNGEVALGNKKEAYVTSTAAGPALEGALIKHGMRAQEGSINEISIDPESLNPDFKTLEDEPPKGICGSGVIDAASEMFKVGIIEANGRFSKEFRDHGRIRKMDEDILEYVLVKESESALNKGITITQKDIREIQKAKGAIQAVTRVLMNRLDVTEFDQVLLAGAFGNYIDKKSSMVLGLFPECELDKIESIGNAAGSGAKLALMSQEERAEADRIPEKVEFVELAGSDEFRDHFIKAMNFPHQNIDLYPRVGEIVSQYREIGD